MGYIHTIKTPDNTTHLIEPTLYAAATATTSNNITVYTASFNTNFELVDGVCVQVKCPNSTNTAGATLNNKKIYYENSPIAAGVLKAGHVYSFVYVTSLDSNNGGWNLVGDIDTDTWRPIGTGANDAAAGNHGHGNISNGGALSTANQAVVTDGNNKITTEDLHVDDPNVVNNVTGTSFISNIATNEKGKITTLTKKNLPTASTSVAGITTVGASGGAAAYDHNHDSTYAAKSHTHGNIQNDGKLQTTDVAIADGDKLVITDATDSNKIARTSLTFDGTTATKALTQKGTWEIFNNYSLPLAANGTRGGIQIGFTTNATNRNYAVQLDSEKAYVNVPWADQNVTQSADTSNVDIPILLKGTTGNATVGAVKYPNTTGKIVSVNPSTGKITAPGGLEGKATSAGTADAVAWTGVSSRPTKLTLTGAVTGEVSLGAGDLSLATTVNHNHDDRYKIANGVITLGSNTITPVTSVNGHTGSTVSVTAGDLGLAAALRFIGKTTSDMSETFTGVPAGITSYTNPIVGDVVLDKNSDAEYVCIAKTTTNNTTTYTWELLGRSGSWSLSDHVHGNITNDGKMAGSTASGDVTTSHKFLREDGTWVIPKYTTNTNTTYTIATGDSNGQIKVTPSSGNAYNVSVKGLDSAAYTPSTDYSYKHLTTYDFSDVENGRASTQPLSKYITFDMSKPQGGPSSTWYNGFISSHGNYLASYIINAHRTADWYVGYNEYNTTNHVVSTAPTWYKLAHSGNIVNNTINLSRNTETTIATIAGVAIKIKLPASDNTNTASAVDNILDGSNSGTAITYAPYSSQQSKLSFDTSSTAPSRTDRLNLNGYLYATKLYSDGTEVSVNGHTHSYLPLAGGNMTGDGGIQFPTTSGNNKTNNWISAGGGYGTGSGKSGVKLIVCEQSDALMGLGADCGGGPYEMSLIAAESPNNTNVAYFRFLKHKQTSTTYTKLAEINGTGDFSVIGNITGTKFHSNAAATDTDLTRIPATTEIALETGNGNGAISAWIWRENYASSNWGIFHNNSTDTLHVVGSSASKLSIILSNGNTTIAGTVTATGFSGSGANLTSLTPTNITGVVTTTAKKFLKDTGAWTQVDWGDLTGKPDSFTPASHTHSHLVSLATINSGQTSSNNNFALALKKYFDDNKSTVPRNSLVNFYSSAYGNGSEVFGYYLSNYDNNPYGGFFIAHYDTPRYVGILSGTYTESKLARIDIGNTITSGQIMISDGTDGKIKSSGYTIAKSVPSNAVFTDHYAWSDITSKPTSIALTGAVTATATTLGSGAISIETTVNHGHGNITSNGAAGQTANWSLANGDGLLVFDASNSNKIERSGITFDGSTTSKALTQKGTWETFNNYSHPTGDGNLHVPATGTGNNGKFLKAGSTAGSLSWATLTVTDISDIGTTYYKLDGSNTGTKLCISTQSAAYTNQIQFMNSTTKKGSIGTDNDGVLGLYAVTKVALRPQLDAATMGVEVTSTAMYPTASITLGTSTAANKWSTVYATTFDGAILKLHQGTAADPSLSGNARIEFDYSGGQPVVISYTPNDGYRAPAGLKIMGGTSATPAWLEVEGQLISQDYTHFNSNRVIDATLVMGARGKKPTATTTDGTTTYSGAVNGTAILTLGNNKKYGDNSSGVDDNAQGIIRLYTSSDTYGQLSGRVAAGRNTIYASTGISLIEDAISVVYRAHASYYTYSAYETSGNEALVFGTQNAVTSFIFVNGESYANVSAARWTKLDGASGNGPAPGLQIKKNCVSIGELIASNTNPSYKLNVKGTTNLNGDVTVTGVLNGVKINYCVVNNSTAWNETNAVKEIFGTTDNNSSKLTVLRMSSSAPEAVRNNYASGIAWKGSDTYGMLTVAYGGANVKIAGGNGSNPLWWFGLNATSGKTYTFPSDSKTLAAADGSNASGTGWAISITGDAGGNAATATKLKTAVSIWGNSFDGSASIAGDLDWDSDTYRQRIHITDDSTADTAVFTFQQSENSGTNYSDLFTIKDNGNIVVGKRITTTSPTSAVETTRIQIIPYYHTGGPWYIASKDDKTYAYLTIKYGENERVETQSSGRISISSTVGAGSTTNLGILNIKTTATISSGWSWGINHTATGLAAGANTCLITGVADSTNNSAVFGFHYAGSNNNGNYAEISLYNNNGLLKVFKTGQVSITTNITSSSTSTGSLIVAGGAGIAGKLYVGDTVSVGTTTTGPLGLCQTDGLGLGLSLYNGPMAKGSLEYGIMFAKTGTFGTCGSVTGTWATYFTMNRDDTRGWVFKSNGGAANGNNNVASIAANGNIYTTGSLTIAKSAAGAIYLSRSNGPNWIQSTANVIAFCANSASLTSANSALRIGLDTVDGYNNNYAHLGSSSVQWKDVHSYKYIVEEKVTLQWNSTDQSLDFIFA